MMSLKIYSLNIFPFLVVYAILNAKEHALVCAVIHTLILVNPKLDNWLSDETEQASAVVIITY